MKAIMIWAGGSSATILASLTWEMQPLIIMGTLFLGAAWLLWRTFK